MRGILNTVLLVPGDYVYVVYDLKNKIVIKCKVESALLTENTVTYRIREGTVKCSRYKQAKVGTVLPCVTKFKNSEIDTGGSVKPFDIFIFTKKEKCEKFLRGE